MKNLHTYRQPTAEPCSGAADGYTLLHTEIRNMRERLGSIEAHLEHLIEDGEHSKIDLVNLTKTIQSSPKEIGQSLRQIEDRQDEISAQQDKRFKQIEMTLHTWEVKSKTMNWVLRVCAGAILSILGFLCWFFERYGAYIVYAINTQAHIK